MAGNDDPMQELQELVPGLSVRETVPATSPQQVAEVLAEATSRGATVAPYGGRRSLATGNPSPALDFGLDLTGLAGIIDYAPADLTLSVRAGTSLAEIQATLGENGQELPIDAPDPARATIGGLVATGFAGPRKLRAGSLRDLLIGCEYVRGDGLLAKAGGLVVKNVSGFEIPRFLHGSWGALAVITSVNLKVMPRTRADATMLAKVSTLGAAIEMAQKLIAREPAIDACVVTTTSGAVSIAVRATGRQAAVSATLADCRDVLSAPAETLEADASLAHWQNETNLFAESDDKIVIAFASRAREISALAAGLEEAVAGVESCDIQVSPGMGSIRVSFPPGHGAGELLVRLSEVAVATGATWVVESAPPEARASIPAWGPSPDGMSVMQSVKREFDPAGILNPGRLFV